MSSTEQSYNSNGASPSISSVVPGPITHAQNYPIESESRHLSAAPHDYRDHDGHTSMDRAMTQDHEPGDTNDVSSNSDEPAKKRRRSRKGLGKRFACSAEGCGKSYSRAEHLYRHQLNHNSKQIFRCEYPNCPRTFVRGDLLKRHMDRHAAKGPQLGRRESIGGNIPQPTPDSMLSDVNCSDHAYEFMNQTSGHHYQSPLGTSDGPYTPISNTPPTVQLTKATSAKATNGYRPDSTYETRESLNSLHDPSPASRPLQASSENAGALSQQPANQPVYRQPAVASHLADGFVPQQNVVPMHLPPAQYPSPHRRCAPSATQSYAVPDSTDFVDQAQRQSSEMVVLDQMAMPGAGPVFGADGELNKSPYVGMPEDFMAYLFNSLPSASSPSGPVLAAVGSNSYGDLRNNQYSTPFMGSDGLTMGYFPSDPQQVMAVNNLLDQDTPEASISEHKSEEIFDLIRDRFHENDLPPVERQRESIISGDRTDGTHMLSRRMMQAYIRSYWYHFSDQMPILHKPTFSADTTPNLLLLAMMTIGAACLDRTHGQQVMKAGAMISNFLARHLRWEIFMDWNFRPPAKLWVFQALILLEIYEKMYSTRELHERAHIHHATTITLMRRGRSLIGKSSLDSPPNAREGQNGSHAGGTSAQTPDEWWNHWITSEATRRAAFAAFVVDTTHATMFGHSGVMAAHEMRLALPCDESLWRATSSAEVARVESNLISQGIKPVSFLEGLKRTLSHQEVRTTSFGRTVLMAGLLSVTYHMHQRDLQVNILGGGVTHALGGRDKWRATLTRAYDSWKADFDDALEQSEPSSDPYRHDAAKHEFNIVFASRTVLHHLAHMAMHADIVDCQIFARAKRLLGRTIGPQEFNGAWRRIQELWAHTARARDATFYALKFLSSVMLAGADGEPTVPGHNMQKYYEARHDVLMNRPWVLYFAALVVWCYGFALEGPCADAVVGTSGEEIQRQMQAYLVQFGGISDPSELHLMRGVNNNTALLMVLKESFENTRWDLLHEAANLLRNCIMLNAGGAV
ncbi:hypothetical protein JDV02_007553 [Purpureocillium takamizusanense]|uniref:C2H2-type domain-containing protein n=1 Tax=Purpureocillium takamizusanense TaxID=2060973 RepID=A0A9Q8VDU3_9HYPO|nr:uncharacterized protein JDV02_007553 [Purpureocillium takamizusanense]UNI21576.1 hypothetical protein JDV02_007553 [Purpureocillium takamizusanense]